MKNKFRALDFTMWFILAISILIGIATIGILVILFLYPEIIGNYLGQIINAFKSTAQ